MLTIIAKPKNMRVKATTWHLSIYQPELNDAIEFGIHRDLRLLKRDIIETISSNNLCRCIKKQG